MRRLVGGILVDAGFDAQAAVDGDHALRSALALRPDLIIPDIYLPEPSVAITFADRYRKRVAADGRAPIIAMSGSPDLDAIGQRIGANKLVKEPFDIEDLLRHVAKYLADPIGADAVVTTPADVAAPAIIEAQPGTSTA